METRTMPETITAMRSITYETDQVVSYVAEAYEKPSDEVTYEEVVEWVKENAYEVMGSRFLILTKTERVSNGSL